MSRSLRPSTGRSVIFAVSRHGQLGIILPREACVCESRGVFFFMPFRDHSRLLASSRQFGRASALQPALVSQISRDKRSPSGSLFGGLASVPVIALCATRAAAAAVAQAFLADRWLCDEPLVIVLVDATGKIQRTECCCAGFSSNGGCLHVWVASCVLAAQRQVH